MTTEAPQKLMAPDLQVLADTEEGNSDARYKRQQELAVLISDAIKRAESFRRLEISLQSTRIRSESVAHHLT